MSVRKGARGARLQRELHGAVGFWVSLMLLVMSASGLTLSFPQTVRAALGAPVGLPIRGGQGREAREPFDINAVLARLVATEPDACIVDPRLPDQSGRPVIARLQRPGSWAGGPPIIVTVDPAGRRVLSMQDPSTQKLALVSLGWLRALHYGDVFGLAWRALVLLAGLALPTPEVTLPPKRPRPAINPRPRPPLAKPAATQANAAPAPAAPYRSKLALALQPLPRRSRAIRPLPRLPGPASSPLTCVGSGITRRMPSGVA